MSQRPASLKTRLLGTAFLVLLFFLGATGLALDKAFQASAEQSLQETLITQVYALLGTINEADQQLVFPTALHDPRLNQLNSGLYALVADHHDNLLWRSPSASVLDYSATPQLAPGEQRFSQPNEQLFQFAYGIGWEFESGQLNPYTIIILQDQAPFRAEVATFRYTLWSWLAGIGLLLLAVQLVIMRWGLRPLNQLAAELTRIETGAQQQLQAQYPDELAGVTTNLNLLIKHEHRQRERYRNTLADLAHSLKTPLALIRGALHGEQFDKRQLDEHIDQADQIISYQLNRASSSGGAPTLKPIPLRPLAEKILRSLDKVYREKNLTTSIEGQAALAIDEGDAMELLGNLLDNACKAARSNVTVSLQATHQQLTLHIDDDGPGVPADQRATILQRGGRADTYAPGQGIGLAIALDILQAYQGTLAISEAPRGGARFTLVLPC